MSAAVSTVEQTSTVGRAPVETEAEILHRLAAQAEARGVKIIQNIVTNHHFASSVSQPGKLHTVTLFSCSCVGFVRHGRCGHHALILKAYHCLPPLDPGPDGGGATLPDPTSRTNVRNVEDVVVSIVPAPRRPTAPRVENPHTRTIPSPVTSGATMELHLADAIEIDGVMVRVGEDVLAKNWRGGWDRCRITSIHRPGAKVWKVSVLTGNGETTRRPAELRAIAASDRVRHAA
jgi:hypothetical protein